VNWREEGLVFPCGEDQLVGILALPENPAPRGVLIVVGGPQYRAGSHRQFTLLARYLAQSGIASLRFDYRGMGDSSGALRTFEHAQEDIRVAIDRLLGRVPALRDVAIWGLCDAASSALMYAPADPRVGALVLVNPWVRTEAGLARAQLQHYYGARLLEASFWKKIALGQFNPLRAARDFVGSFWQVLGGSRRDDRGKPLPERMEGGLRSFKGPVLLSLSGKDLTAQEFTGVVDSSAGWQSLLRDPRVTRCDLAEANHTFSRRDWRERVASWTAAWLRQGPDSSGNFASSAGRSASWDDPRA
jgi:exosortase A-associated hydrolase 1